MIEQNINNQTRLSSVIKLSSSSIIEIDKVLDNFDTNKLSINISENNGFKFDIMYSVLERDTNYQNWSIPKSIDEFENEINIISQNNFRDDLSIRIKFIITDISQNHNLLQDTNIFNQIPKHNNVQRLIVIDDIEYDGCSLIDSVKIISNEQIVNKYPVFNLYSNQEVVINRWLQECVAVNNRLGHHCIYFKTEITDTNNTLQSIENRVVNSVKRMIVSVPDNELPTDRTTFTEWDIPMMEDFIIHIPTIMFQNLFGNEIPSNEDFIYLPILNKLYSINTVQPGGRYMGKTGWWECYLVKYEDDEIVSNRRRIENSVQHIDKKDAIVGIQNVIETIPNINDKDISELYAIFEEASNDSVLDNGTKTLPETIEEKKDVTEGFSNRLIDSTHYVDLKETDYQREKYHNRLKIITINPASLTFPLNVYDASDINDREIALTYNLKEATKVNKYSTEIDSTKDFKLYFNFVMLKRFNSDLVDIVSNNVSIINLSLKGKSLLLTFREKEYKIDYKFIENKLYQIELGRNYLKIFDNNEILHILEFNDLSEWNYNLTEIVWYGGNYYFGNCKFFIETFKIVDDKNIPVLMMNNFPLAE